MSEHGGGEAHAIAITVLTRDDAAPCEQIARSLPAWFGIEEAFADIRAAVEREQRFAARVDDEIVGFVPLTVLPALWSPANPCLLMVRTIPPGL